MYFTQLFIIAAPAASSCVQHCLELAAQHKAKTCLHGQSASMSNASLKYERALKHQRASNAQSNQVGKQGANKQNTLVWAIKHVNLRCKNHCGR